MTTPVAELYEASTALRTAQRAYMADRGNETLGQAVGTAAENLDDVLSRISCAELATGIPDASLPLLAEKTQQVIRLQDRVTELLGHNNSELEKRRTATRLLREAHCGAIINDDLAARIETFLSEIHA